MTQLQDWAARNKPATEPAPKVCPECSHPFHPAGKCQQPVATRGNNGLYTTCLCERNMAVSLDITPPYPPYGESLSEKLIRLETENAALKARRRVGGPESTNGLLEEILAELRRANSTERTGAVSSAQIKTSTRGYDIDAKAYAGSDVPVDEALEAYGRLVREANERALNGWAETVAELTEAKSP